MQNQVIVGLLGMLLLASPLAGQEANPADTENAGARNASALGVRQQRVKRMMQDLDRKFKSLAATLEKTEPEQAERLVKAFVRSKELLIERRMSEISRLLDATRLDSASGEQQQIVDDLKLLIDVLLNENADWEKLRAEIEQLEHWRDQIGRLIEDEDRLRRESEKIANKSQTLADLERQIRALEGLIRKQQELAEAAQAAQSEGLDKLEQVADRQHQLQQQTDALADDIAGGGKGNPADSEAKPPAPADQKTGEEQRPKPEGSPPKPPPEEPPTEDRAASQEPGVEPLRKSAGHQQSAVKQLAGGKGKQAQGEQQRSLAEMKAALGQLRREHDRIAKLPPEVFGELSKSQDATAEQTARLREDIAKAAQQAKANGADAAGGKPDGAPNGEQLSKAGESMQKASGELGRQQPGDAAGHQRDAVESLKRALREIEKRLAQLREETKLEKLARLEARFREMLARQEKVTAATAALEKTRLSSGGRLPRSDRLALRQQADEERALAEQASEAQEIIVDDGTSVVFARIVAQLEGDLVGAAELLDARRTDAYTQSLQAEIEQTLKELIAALQRATKQKQAEAGGGGGGGGMQPLLPNSAELKLLRSAQLRVNRRTAAFQNARPDGPLDELMQQQIRSIVTLQEEITLMTEEILERF